MLIKKTKNGRNRSGTNGTPLTRMRTSGQTKSGRNGIPHSGRLLKKGVIGSERSLNGMSRATLGSGATGEMSLGGAGVVSPSLRNSAIRCLQS